MRTGPLWYLYPPENLRTRVRAARNPTLNPARTTRTMTDPRKIILRTPIRSERPFDWLDARSECLRRS
jgi:hypothetical protein